MINKSDPDKDHENSNYLNNKDVMDALIHPRQRKRFQDQLMSTIQHPGTGYSRNGQSLSRISQTRRSLKAVTPQLGTIAEANRSIPRRNFRSIMNRNESSLESLSQQNNPMASQEMGNPLNNESEDFEN